MSKPKSFWLAWLLCVLFLIITLFDQLLSYKNDPSSLPASILFGLIFLIFITVGAFIASHRPENPIGWIMCAAALIWVFSDFALEYAAFSLITARGSLPLGVFVGLLGSVGRGYAWFSMITFLLLLFPNGHLPSPRWWPLAWLITALLIAYPFTFMFDPTPFLNSDQRLVAVQNPLGIPGTSSLFDKLNTLVVVSFFACAIACIVSVVIRFRRAKGDERQQLKWLAYGTIMSLLILVVIIILMVSNVYAGFVPNLVFYLPVLIFSISVGMAILRYRLYNIDIIINRTLVYGILTALLALVYFGLIFTIQFLLRGIISQNNSIAIVVSTLAIAALFQPLRHRIQNIIDRHFYRRKYDAARIVETFSATLRSEVDLNQLRENLITVVQDTMQPAHISLWLREPNRKSSHPDSMQS